MKGGNYIALESTNDNKLQAMLLTYIGIARVKRY